MNSYYDVDANTGALTCSALSHSQKLIVTGYKSGHLILWDLSLRTPLKLLPPILNTVPMKKDGHIQGNSILHVAFVGPKDRFVSADAQGHAFYHAFNKYILLQSWTYQRIHNRLGEKNVLTTVYAMEALPHLDRVVYPGAEHRLVALSTPFKVVSSLN